MHAQAKAARTGVASLSPEEPSLLAELLGLGPACSVAPAAPPWAAPARMAPLRGGYRSAPSWPSAQVAARRPLAIAAALLIAGGVTASSLGAAPVRAAVASGPAAAAVSAPAGGSLASLRVAKAAPASDSALLARLLAAAPASDVALLSSLIAAPAPARAQPVAFAAVEFASGPAAPAAPATVSFNTVVGLPSTAFNYEAAALSLPEITLDAQRITYPPAAPPPPAPPVAVAAQGQQPPAPPGYVQPPGYQDGVPFGGQLGAVPGSSAARRPAGGTSAGTSTRRVVAGSYVVRQGDTLSAIALRYYGNARYAATIWDANYRLIGADPNRIFPGQRLALPGVTVTVGHSTAAPLPARGPIAQRANYTIQPRDFLRWIAQRAYGNEMLWPEIYYSNLNVLGPNPDLIYPGVRVYIP
jgi:nucleoid-associated protein YgaU